MHCAALSVRPQSQAAGTGKGAGGADRNLKGPTASGDKSYQNQKTPASLTVCSLSDIRQSEGSTAQGHRLREALKKAGSLHFAHFYCDSGLLASLDLYAQYTIVKGGRGNPTVKMISFTYDKSS